MKTVRLVALSLLYLLLFNEPILSLMTQPRQPDSLPVLYAYVMLAWALSIGLLAYVIHRSPPADDTASDE